MATFQEHVYNITHSAYSCDINLGIKEVISNVLKFNPSAGLLFSKESEEQDSNGYKVNSGLIYSVVREDGTDNQWREARQVDISKQYLVTDPNSFFFASKYNPVFIRDNNLINVYPLPNSSNETYKVTHIDYPKYDNDGNLLNGNTDIDNIGIENFPSAFHPHIILYGAIKSLVEKQNELLLKDEDSELSGALAAHIKKLQDDFVNMFLSKDVLTGGSQQQEEGSS